MCWQLDGWQLCSLCQTYPLFIINFKELLHGHNEAEGAPDLGQMALGFVPCTPVPAPSVGSVGQGPAGKEAKDGTGHSPGFGLSSVKQEGLRNHFEGLSQLLSDVTLSTK